MKKTALLFVLLSLMLIVGCACAQEAETYHIVMRYFPLYIGSVNNAWGNPFPLYFINGVNDVPYVDLESWTDMFVDLNRYYGGDENFDMIFSASGTDAAYVRENEYHMQFDFAKQTIFFDDYNAFLHHSGESSLLDMLGHFYSNELGESQLFQRNLLASYDRYGDEITLNLADYNIPMIMQDGKYYIPLQTMNDLLISPSMLSTILYNGRSLIMGTRKQLGTVSKGLTDLGELYYAAGVGDRSAELAEFGYNELCFVLDNFYGLKDPHEITSFHQFFWQMGFDVDFKTLSALEADKLLYKVIDFYLDDLHSEFTEYSYLSGKRSVEWGTGPATQKFDDAVDTYEKAREAYYPAGFFDDMPDGPFLYEEVGNTAYITFDSFVGGYAEDYYGHLSNLPEDTIGLIIYAHNQIYREGSPIENVVLDLSNNTGGEVDAAIFVMAWFLGEAKVSVKDTFTGALSTASYRADVNLDHFFNSGDVVDDKNLFVLISPVSFSCGNLIPAAFKASDKVTVIGRTSGGGSCTVQPLSTAWGTCFQISGPTRLSFLKNGSFYDIDTGVTPDYTISKPSNFYDHEALTDFINNMIF